MSFPALMEMNCVCLKGFLDFFWIEKWLIACVAVIRKELRLAQHRHLDLLFILWCTWIRTGLLSLLFTPSVETSWSLQDALLNHANLFKLMHGELGLCFDWHSFAIDIDWALRRETLTERSEVSLAWDIQSFCSRGYPCVERLRLFSLNVAMESTSVDWSFGGTIL